VLTVLFGLSASLSYSLHDFIMVRVSKLARPLTGMFWVFCCSLAIMLPIALIVDGLPHGSAQWHAIVYAAVGGVFYVTALLALLHGFAVGALSLVTPLAALEGAFASVYSLLTGEPIGLITGVALVLAVVGAVAASVGPRDAAQASDDRGLVLPAVGGRPPRRPRFRSAAGAGWGLISGMLFAVTLVLYGHTGALGPVTAAAAGRLASLPLVLPVVLLAGAVRLPGRLQPRTLLAGAFEAGGYVAAAAALARGPVSVASVTVAQFATFAVVLGMVVLHERPARHQLIGIASTVVAVTLFGFAS
jgi:drug/metabolite transporter (DMT)-like permease